MEASTSSLELPSSMTERAWPDHVEIVEPSAVALLSNLRALRYLNPFLRAAHNLSSAATAIGRPPSSVAYWVQKLLGEGLIVQLGDIPRAGRPMPVYRAAARQLRVPFDRLPFDSRVALLDEGRTRVLLRFLDGLDEAMVGSAGFALEFSAVGKRSVVELIEPPVESRPRNFTDAWLNLRLSAAAARELCVELEELLKRYADRGGPGEYVVHVGIAPEPKHPWRSANDPRWRS
ncbi:MAG: hypothetical protein ACRCYQ_14795 [Nocardioides sp.]